MAPVAGVSAKLKRSDRTSSAVLDRINGISEPAAKASIHLPLNTDVLFAGWAIDEPNKMVAGGVDIAIDDVPYSAVYGDDRSDVSAALNNPACRNSGFVLVIPAAMLVKGPHVATVRAISHDKKSYYEGPTVKFTIE